MVFLIGCALIMSAPLFYAISTGTAIAGDDALFHLARIRAVSDSLAEGTFPCRIYAGGHTPWGVPTGVFYPSLWLYIPAALHALGLSLTAAANAFAAGLFVLAALFAWYACRLLGEDRRLAFGAAALYVSSFYFPINAYIRFDLGELAALAFLPVAMAAIWRAFGEGLSAGEVMAGVFAVTGQDAQLSYVPFWLAGLSLLLNLWFYVPFLVFYRAVPVKIKETFDVFYQSGWPVSLLTDILLHWGPGTLLFAAATLAYLAQNQGRAAVRAAAALLFGAFSLLLATDAFPWPAVLRAVPGVTFIQFPYRFLILGSPFLALAAGFGFWRFAERLRWGIGRFGLAALLLCGLHIAGFVGTSGLAPGHRLAFDAWRNEWTGSNVDYLYRDADVAALRARDAAVHTAADIADFQKRGASLSFRYRAEAATDAELPLVVYPGCIARDSEGNVLPLTPGANHLATLRLSPGEGKVMVHYEETPLFLAADLLSLLTALGCLAALLRQAGRRFFA